MSDKDKKPEGQPGEEADPLSATGMFLSALGTDSDQSRTPREDSTTQPAASQDAWSAPRQQAPAARPAPTEPPQGSPGEFTRMFQAANSSPSAPPSAPASAPQPKQAQPEAPGEFTRIFVKPSERASSPPASQASDAPSIGPATPSAPRMKGFSSGGSDSASGEASFTQMFQPRPTAPPAASTPRVQTFSPPPVPNAPPAPIPAPREDVRFSRQPDFSAHDSAPDADASASSVTSLFASLGPAGQRQESRRLQPDEAPISFPPSTPAEPPATESGSVTRLIQRLSETPPAAVPVAPAPVTPVPAPAVNSGPGEFTRMISNSAFKAPAGEPVAPAPAAPSPAQPIQIPVAKPAAPAMPAPPPMPVAAAPAVHTPKLEPPAVTIPKPAPPVIAAPQSKLQEMVPILLVINTFLLLVLIVLVIFALKAR